MLEVKQLSGGYSGYSVLKDISFHVAKGELFGILGPNGSGKTTLLKMISGLLPFKEGSIFIKEKKLSQYTQKELAKVVAVLPQHSEHAFSYTVKETVSLGRYAHQSGFLQTWTEEDEKVVQKVMKQTGVEVLQNKNLRELSGGERQRVNLAQALAQEPEILLLDEPTNHLDLSYQKELLDILKTWTRDGTLTVISIFHDLNLAGLYCDRLLLLKKGMINIQHKTNEVLKEDRIQEVYQTDIKKFAHPKVPVPQITLLPKWEKEEQLEAVKITADILQHDKQHIVLKSPIPLKTMSSGVVGAGLGWHQTFVNRHVDRGYSCSNHQEEMMNYLCERGFDPLETVGMMTAVVLDDVSYKWMEEDTLSVFVVVTAGVGNAVDATQSENHSSAFIPGTINTWIFINGKITEEAFIQGMVTATEAKVRALEDQKVIDSVTGTYATGTSTDSISIAATQRGEKHDFAGSITPLGKLISKAVYMCTRESIQKSQKRK
ncbi:adenosylcobinamide amidohydrolase [Oceanobacillus sp. Castelsardo]|uniref:adenosylcobinamide amidohydrolase n=1 Tax=Oceanobacillus sp. Castelsardo TaxID=1851204 RepID=UPI0008397DB1|nr:adenosylcobinamide amidohydrolase [Oceanobacillus sp. Castelsardo]